MSGHLILCSVEAVTTEIPHEVSIALPRRVKRPRLDHPPMRTFWFSGKALTEGIEEHLIDEVKVRIYGPEKTVADCFKFRNKIGLNVAIEALKLCRELMGSTPRKLLYYARICRVERVMRPYLEALG
jgi:predicted transcriptional regulator of viral defense system